MVTDSTDWHLTGPEPLGASRQVYVGILRALEAGRMVPGQRLVETDLAQEHGVGRNAVREAMQYLAARGIVDLSPNRSPAIRRLDLAESLEVLDVADAMMRIAAAAAARAYRPEHAEILDTAIDDIEAADRAMDDAAFSRARRHFYRALLLIGGNRELHRLFPAIAMHIIHVQYPLPRLRHIRRRDYGAIARAVRSSDAAAAEAAAARHVDEVRSAIESLKTGRR